MRSIVTALLAAVGAEFATVLGSLLPGLVLLPVPSFPALPTVVRALTVPSVMATAALFGWLLIRWRPSLSIEAVVGGLICFTLTPLLALAAGGTLPPALLGCAAEAIVALSFALPVTWKAGKLATSKAKMGYVVVVAALFPAVVGWALNDRSQSVSSVKPLATRVPNAFVSPSAGRGRER